MQCDDTRQNYSTLATPASPGLDPVTPTPTLIILLRDGRPAPLVDWSDEGLEARSFVAVRRDLILSCVAVRDAVSWSTAVVTRSGADIGSHVLVCLEER